MSPEDVKAAVLRRWPGFRGSYADLDEWLGLPEGSTERIVGERTPTASGEGEPRG